MMTPVLDLIVRIARVPWAGLYFRMARRICYVHVGPHKTGTTSIQWFLQENGPALLAHGYFVPESETKRGAHHALAEGLTGLDVGEDREPLVTRSIAAMAETPARAMII